MKLVPVGKRCLIVWKLHFLRYTKNLYSTDESGMIVELFSRRLFIKILICLSTISIFRFRITVHFIGNLPRNFSKNFLFDEKIYFGIGASIASFIFFFLLGYLSVYFSKYAQSDKTWKYINIFIIGFMSLLTIYIVKETVYFL